ncbi:YciE/YciF ferroxidase family protein [Polluticaenibacter yanchengensis]|uniref:Ferritin-like domain-containing protein n=1 Tax=Polluticaenibacter yanchengensis TaxID=3014562 RepID=A0ABT4UES3_9BACT|nr:ferritin-like domain-containing protein [Chitinophagaceae bacterium LY-5]
MPSERKQTAAATGTAGSKNKTTSNIPGPHAPLEKYFKDALKDILWAEQAIITGLKKMQKEASNESLTDALEDHEIETHKHVSRLEKVFEIIGEKAEPKKCAAMEGILKEADEMIASTPGGSATRDAIIIIAAQKVEHYEIATYGGLVAIAHTLELDKAAKLLQKTLDEEEDTYALLTDIAEGDINFEAAEEGDEDDDNGEKDQ